MIISKLASATPWNDKVMTDGTTVIPASNAGNTRQLDVRYFAWVREKTGLSFETVSVPRELATVADLIVWLKARGPEFEAAFASPAAVRVAIDKVHARADALIADAREIAFFPPVTGG